MRRLFWSALLYFLLFASVLHAQQYNFENFTIENGLVQSQVNTVFQDSKGYIWLGTQGGVSRFDGQNFQSWSTDNGLVSNKITAIYEDSKGDIWLASEASGVSRFDGMHFTSLTEEDSLIHNEVNVIYEDNEANLWFGTFGGVSIWDGEKFTHFTQKDGLSNNNVQAIFQDGKQNIWLGTYGGGLCKYNGLVFSCHTTTDGLINDYITDIHANASGDLVIGTFGGFSIFNGKEFQNFGRGEGLLSYQVNDLDIDDHDNIWLATGSGAAEFHASDFRFINENNGLVNNDVNSILVDREGNLWFGTGKGLSKLSNRSFVHFGEKEGLAGVRPTDVIKGAGNQLLVGNELGGIYVQNENGFSPFQTDANIAERSVSTLAIDQQNRLWIGTMDFEGVFVIDGNSSEHFTEEDGLADNNANDILCDSKGNTWIASAYGVTKIDSSGLTVINVSEEMGTNHILSMMEDHFGNIWLGSFDGSISKFDGTRFTHFGEEEGLQGEPIREMVQDKVGNMYFRTSDHGIIAFKNNEFRYITEDDGLRSNNVRAMTIDNNDLLWLGTQKGISALQMDESGKVKVKNYGHAEGFIPVECLPNTAYYDRDGLLWFGTIKGLTRFDPEKERINQYPPEVVISDVLLFFKKFDYKQYSDSISDDNHLPVDLNLPHNENYLMFEFTGISHTAPEKVRYQWMLEGFDDDWLPPTKLTEANYSNLPPGNYTFKVKACNEEGIWSNEPATFSFTVTPPFWRTTWFYISVVAVVIILIFVYVKLRERKLLREKKVLEQKVQARTFELQRQKEIVEEQHHHITESIRYAKNIQMAILPSEEEIAKIFKEYFVLYRPKDIVGGDFYWLHEDEDKRYIAAVDCTGHGVAGAFMSMIGSDLLNQIVIEKKIADPGKILTLLKSGIKLAFQQSAKEFEMQQGMDIAFCTIDKKNGGVDFAGALRPVFLVKDKELTEVSGDKISIGGMYYDDFEYNSHHVEVEKGTCIYLLSDGYTDQFGGPKGKKFMTRRLKNLLIKISEKPMEEQNEILRQKLDDWKGDLNQVDDILVMGVRL